MSEAQDKYTDNLSPSPEGGRAFRQQVIEVAASHDQTAHVRELRPDITIPIALAAARFALQQAREIVKKNLDSQVEIEACSPGDDYAKASVDAVRLILPAVDRLLAELDPSSAVPVREQQEQIETEHLGGHESHGGRGDLEPAARPELSHDEPSIRSCPMCGQESAIGTVTYADDSDTARVNGQHKFYFVKCVYCGVTKSGLHVLERLSSHVRRF